ncbi:hypothetical protein F5Y05DRAFT_371023 [Hypoxylon sp. FL0543]|nr:hypothetical protein F5Y05DRAFT_371023 [Hypoxylon sp. FL0543]
MSRTSTMTSSLRVLPLHCSRSDGKRYDESRFPPTHQLAQPGDEQPWLAKLGELLRDQLFPGSDRTFVLDAFPENYHLRVRNRNDGSHHDFYLYGYPETEGEEPRGRQPALKSYRSPADFFDHLLWLITDPENDRKNCYCRHCRPPLEIADRAPHAAVLVQPRPEPLGTHPTVPGGGIPGPAVPAMATPGTMASSTAPTTPMATATATLAPPTSLVTGQLYDEADLFRVGEVVWYRNMQQAFRLGIVVQNQPAGSQSYASSIIKPLSHSRNAIDNVQRPHVEMRPFLTFSVPPVHAALQAVVHQPMASVQWDVLESTLPFEEKTRAQMLSLEASKIAACHTDHSFSLFNPVSRWAAPHAPVNQQAFGGVFFGCEKIGMFEAARVRVDDTEYVKNKDVEYTFAFVIQSIVLERLDIDNKERLLFQGDIWHLQESASPQHAPNQDQLPRAMRREKAFRDKVASVRGVHFDWVRVLANVTKTEDAIRGRFYESEKLGPILYQSEWEPSLQQGVVPSIEMRLNNRGDSLGPHIGRKRSRIDTFAGAVPPGNVLFLQGVTEWPGEPQAVAYPA